MSPFQKINISDIGEYQKKEVITELFPESVNEIKDIVKQAVADKTPLYPISTGKNWGLGSTKPVVDNSILVNMSRLNKIRNIDLEMGTAIIEAGVTQGDLSSKLADTPYMLNVTRSIAETSILANTLERGLGSIRQRSKDLLALEVITGEAEQIHCGSFWSTGRTNLAYSHGVGPELTPLFMQSNLGVSTAAIINLVKRPEKTIAIEMTIAEDKLSDFIMAIRRLYQQQCFFGILRIFNNESLYHYEKLDNKNNKGYKLIASIAGSKDDIENRKKQVEKALKEFSSNRITFTTLDSTVLHPEYLSYIGVPHTDSVTNVFRVKGNTDLDNLSDKGFLAFIPLIPFDKKNLNHVIKMLEAFESQYSLQVSLTINIFNDSYLYFAIFIYFNRGADQNKDTHKAFDKLKSAFISKGYLPYRIDIDSHKKENFSQLYGEESYIKALKKIKNCFDPHNIISPGRYIS